MRTRNRILIKKTMNCIEKTSNKNCQNDDNFNDVAKIRLFHVGGMLPLARGRASQSYPL
ncbi:MAG: hypothetical protein UT97_C0020G0011 [Parcubacteria group bacterium GW2011_GWC2_40_31]|nr:MAG: hypothetical protein UT97_C0020G0011 [Parcubacteria group bacterium GW2011_GWC2_40_31]